MTDRPTIGGGGDRPWRPGRPGTRPGSDWWSNWHGGDNRPWRPDGDWGWNGNGNHWNNDWHNHWHDHHVHNHHDNWYHGSWSGNWSNNWYVPSYIGASAWGLGTVPSTWGYGSAYYNPYYSEPVATASPSYYYDYSQPVAVYDYGQQYDQQDYSQQYVTAQPQPQAVATEIQPQAAPPIVQTTAPTPPQAEPPTTEPGLEDFDAALAAFKSGDYRLALQRCNEALRSRPKDPVIHEVRALTLFAQGDYKSAAATLNSLLAMSPGMDWTTLSGLYGNADDYAQQLRRLEAQCQSNPRDAAAHFVLAYHYLVTGHAEEAVEALRVVVAQQPRDATAKRMLDSLAPPDEPAAIAATPPEPSGVRQTSATEPSPPQPSATQAAQAAPAGPQTDLVGRWRAVADGTTIELAIDDASQFEWSATPSGGTATKLSGSAIATSDTLVLDSETQGSMVGQVKPISRDEFRFALAGGPPDAKGLDFRRVR
jgi:tetratricopeptide (TPR) repeat protein